MHPLLSALLRHGSVGLTALQSRHCSTPNPCDPFRTFCILQGPALFRNPYLTGPSRGSRQAQRVGNKIVTITPGFTQ